MLDARAVAPFSVTFAGASRLGRLTAAVAAPVVERVLGLSALGRLYEGTRNLDADFAGRALDRLGIQYDVDPTALSRVPRSGPLVIIANHPFGAADGLVLLALAMRVRPDVRLLGNYLLQRVPELASHVIAVDPFGGPAALARNRRMLRRAIDWTSRGGALIVFPAGEVSGEPAADGALVDAPWKPGVARIIAETGADVLPVYFHGRNSRTFEAAGRIHPGLRTALLPRELLRMRNRRVVFEVGEPVPAQRMRALGSHAAVLAYLRARTYGLRPAAEPTVRVKRPQQAVPPPSHTPADLAEELARLPPERLLLSSRAYEVYFASASEIPAALLEIGRLRELAFRAAGEGSGLARDLDEFDRHYWHLFVWDREQRAIAGAYRLGATDAIVPRLGVRGLYTRTLFSYGRAFVDAVGPALELGRSFVRVEYQREFSPLLLLWQGIGRFVARQPRYRRLFGPVSISASYTGASRDALVDMLTAPSFASPLTGLVRARRPYRYHTSPARPVVSVDPAEVQSLIGDVEPDGKGMPVLLRQYLKLNARVAAISVDPDFANVVDALSIVDLDQIDEATRRRYVGA